MIYQLVLEAINRADIDTSTYTVVAEHLSTVDELPFVWHLVAKPHIVAHVKLYELAHIARKIPQLYAPIEPCEGQMCNNGLFYYYARLDFVHIDVPPSNCDGLYDFRFVDFPDGNRVYWDAFVLDDVEEMDASKCLARSVDNNSVVC